MAQIQFRYEVFGLIEIILSKLSSIYFIFPLSMTFLIINDINSLQILLTIITTTLIIENDFKGINYKLSPSRVNFKILSSLIYIFIKIVQVISISLFFYYSSISSLNHEILFSQIILFLIFIQSLILFILYTPLLVIYCIKVKNNSIDYNITPIGAVYRLITNSMKYDENYCQIN